MAASAAALVESQYLPTSNTTLYTAPISGVTSVMLRKVLLTNTSGSTQAVTLYLVKTAGTAGGSNTVLSAFSLAAGLAYPVTELTGLVLMPGDSIQGFAGSGTVVVISVGGVIFS